MKEENKFLLETDEYTFLVLDFGLHILDGVAGLDLKRDRLSS